MRSTRAWLLAAAAFALMSCAEGPTDLQLARGAADDGDRPRAVGYYQRHLEAAPDDFDARLEYALLLGEIWAFQGGDPDPILHNLDLLFQADPSNLRVREYFAMMLVRQAQAAMESSRWDEAEAFLLHAIDVHPDVGTANYHLGVVYAGTGRGEEAFSAWVAAALKRPQIPDLYLRLGREYLERDALDRAVNTLLLVDELRGVSTYLLPEANCSLALAYQRRGDAEVAQERYERAGSSCEIPGLSR
jgi:tetratricopeptide (TPR) repeat protein